CLVNNHLEPAHDAAIRAVLAGREGKVSVACPLTKKWARTLSDEFKSGACHAGRYETSIVMAAAPELVDEAARQTLPPVPISLSKQLAAGVTTFEAMGMELAYAGDPKAASIEEGERMILRLAEMVVGEVREALGLPVA
ncbi:MAG TPA: creatininase family protein, partial [Kofleriaceae bacterium]|nr:creatininase family protein [Kofleriaceae bacterium]